MKRGNIKYFFEKKLITKKSGKFYKKFIFNFFPKIAKKNYKKLIFSKKWCYKCLAHQEFYFLMKFSIAILRLQKMRAKS